MYVIGVDVGGTNTDAVLLKIERDGKSQVLRTNKAATSSDVCSGVIAAVQAIIEDVNVTAVMVGTTHFINALIQRKGLAKVCTIRLCGPAAHAIRPMSNWPVDLKQSVEGLTKLTAGGYFFDGSEISALDEKEIRSIVHQATELGIVSFCVSGIFATCRKDQEERVAQWIREEVPNAFITISHEIAGLGLSERENAAILNACLRPLAAETIGILQDALPSNLPFYLTRNNGTLLSAKDAMRWPVFTFASGPTNSMIGAAYLSGIDNAIVVDVGGTSIDIGMIVDGKPRQTVGNVRLVDDIRVNISTSDTISLPVGGGTVVHADENDEQVQFGPDSVGFRLEQEALAFGGKTMTGTDIAIAAGLASGIGHVQVQVSSTIVKKVLDYVSEILIRGVDRMKITAEPLPLILCGGGSIIIDSEQTFPGISQVILSYPNAKENIDKTFDHSLKITRPDHYNVCNAVGAALCAVSATIDVITDLIPSTIDGGNQREEALRQLTEQVYRECEKNGARKGTIRLVDLEPVPLAYHPGGHKHRVLLTAIGQLDLDQVYQEENDRQTSRETILSPKEPPIGIKPPVQRDYIKRAPMFDEHGLWCIDDIDIEYIAYGAGILGCGGGGESYHSKLWCLQILYEGKQKMRVCSSAHFDSSSDLIGNVAFMGAPTVSHELLPNGYECSNALRMIEDNLSKPISAVFSGEIGGANGLMGLIVAAQRQIPCVDCDGLGRAFPCLNHLLAFIRGMPVTPTALCDVRGDCFLCTQNLVQTPKELEDLFRVECTKRGLAVGISFPCMNGTELKKYTLLNSISRAWFLGQAKYNNSKNPIEAVAKAGQGRILIQDGTVKQVERNTTGGFARGFIKIESSSGCMKIEFQNENLIVQADDGRILATVPDLITLVEQDSAEPLATEVIKYGYRVSVLVLPAPEPLTTPESIEHLGPKAFGYDFPNYEYKPSYASIPSVWDIFYQTATDVKKA